ncbi:hypothetical protein DXG01_013672 [Tephrocybe rancida]|nr:hypothetical protein DXG01_013672 [Tephrocybe rancida]
MSSKRRLGEDNNVINFQKKRKPNSNEADSLTMQPLQQSLDFSALNTVSTISERFDLIGHALLHDFHLIVKSGSRETAFEILELEFYLRKDGCHEDPFTHGSEEQRVSGRWCVNPFIAGLYDVLKNSAYRYFHRAPRRSTDSTRSSTSLTAYRGGSRKGMDLTIGGPTKMTASPYFDQPQASSEVANLGKDSTRGGALLRSLRRLSDNKVIAGPSLLVDEILRLSDAADIPELVEQKWAKDTSAFGSRPVSLFLRPRSPSSQPKPTVYHSPRIGLDLSHPGTTPLPSHPRVTFLSQPYRYFTYPDLLTTKGRPQTFLGILRTSLSTTRAGLDLDSQQLLSELVRITGLGEKTASRYLEYYKDGVDSGKLEDFVGARGKGAGSSPALYLQMMGALAGCQASDEQP